MKPIVFPRDEGFHKSIIEWWYFNGHLEGEDGKQYAFMNCLFKADASRVKIPLLRIPLKTIYFSHSILTNISSGKFYPNVDLMSVVSRDSFNKELLYINYSDPIIIDGYVNKEIEEIEAFKYHVKTETFDLNMESTKEPLLVGGNGFLNLSERKTYYYSLTSLKTQGEILIGNKKVKVKGKSWMDHQWADTPYSHDKWTWFSIQLNNGIEILCCEYGEETRDVFASIVYKDGSVEHVSDLEISSRKAPWKSKKTKAEYELFWNIVIPSKNIYLEADPLIRNQEMLFGSINYWEGPLSITGKIKGRKVSGKGFLELVGRPSRYGSIKYLKDILTQKLKNINFKKIKFNK